MIHYYIYLFILISLLLIKLLNQKEHDAKYTYTVPFIAGAVVCLLMRFVFMRKIDGGEHKQLVAVKSFVITLFITAGICVSILYYLYKNDPEYIKQYNEFIDVWVNGILFGMYITSLFMWKSAKPGTCIYERGVKTDPWKILTWSTVVEILYQIALMFIFLCIFYFTYVHGVEKKSFNTQINQATKKVYQGINDTIHMAPSTQQKIHEATTCYMSLKQHEALSPSQIKQNNSIETHNNELLREAFSLCIYIVGIIIVIFSLLRPNIICMNALGSIVKYIGMMIVVVALTELTYLELFASEYQSVNANTIQTQIYTRFGTNLKLISPSGKPIPNARLKCAGSIEPTAENIEQSLKDIIDKHL